MPASSVFRSGANQPNEPVIHELPGLWVGEEEVALFVAIRRSDDGIWRGCILFRSAELGVGLSTAEILWGASESEIWTAVRDLGEHHLRALYRSLAGL